MSKVAPIMFVYMYLAGFLITLSPDRPFASTELFSVKKVAIVTTKSATIAFSSSPPFLLLALSFSPFLFPRYFDFEASRAQETFLLTLFHVNDCKFR